MIKREQRLDNVARIARANAHAQHKVMLKIQADMDRSTALQEQKAALLEKRFAVRRQVNSEKTELMKKVEAMKRTGNFDKAQLAKFGINLNKAESQCGDNDATMGSAVGDSAVLTPNAHSSVKPPRRIKPLHSGESATDEPTFKTGGPKSHTPQRTIAAKKGTEPFGEAPGHRAAASLDNPFEPVHKPDLKYVTQSPGSGKNNAF